MDKLIIIPKGKIRDYVDGDIRPDTPEEYVRQTVEKRLVNELKYAKERIAIEYNVQIGAGKKRTDIFAKWKNRCGVIGLRSGNNQRHAVLEKWLG